MSSASRRLTAIINHLSSPALTGPAAAAAAALTPYASNRLRSFHTRLSQSRLTPLTDANIAISRLPTALPLPAAAILSPSSASYASVWSSIVASASFSSRSTSATPIKPIIPPQSAADAGKLTVVLDMDECLLHSTFDATLPSSTPHGDLTASPPPTPLHPPYRHPTEGYPYNVTLIIGDAYDGEQRVYVSFRPYLLQFLLALHRRYEVILFTSALPIYAAPVLAYLSGAVQQLGGSSSSSTPLFRHQLYRSSTVAFPSFPYVKDIRRLNRPLQRTVIVDNNAYAMIATPENAVLVPDWEGGEKEEPEVLREVLKFLERVEELVGQKVGGGGGGDGAEGGGGGDVRPLLRESLRFREQMEATGLDFAKNGIV